MTDQTQLVPFQLPFPVIIAQKGPHFFHRVLSNTSAHVLDNPLFAFRRCRFCFFTEGLQILMIFQPDLRAFVKYLNCIFLIFHQDVLRHRFLLRKFCGGKEPQNFSQFAMFNLPPREVASILEQS
jgi:hypothetical protein